jgi:diguanylate cyclase (GGDEF)-like protein
LTVALVAAAVIMFQQPLRFVLDAAQDIERQYRLDLTPALLLLAVVFMFHQFRKHEQMRAEAAAAKADAALARTQSSTLQQLMTFSHALANALDQPTLQQVLGKHMPTIAHERTWWVLVRKGNSWEGLLQDATATGRSVDLLERLANRALSGAVAVVDHGAPEIDDVKDVCFPLHAGGTVVGVLGISSTPPLTEEDHHVVAAAAALIAIGVKNMQLFLETRELSLRDALTGCFNRGHGIATLETEMRRARRSGGPLSILMFDVDHFKTINDRFGHLRGDEVLAAIGAQVEKLTRSTDVRCRYGGDEFVVILPETPILGAKQVAEGLRLEIANLKTGPIGEHMQVSISIGVAAAVPGEVDAKVLINRADQALYHAKSAGGNRLSMAAAPSAGQSRSGPLPFDRGQVPAPHVLRSAVG